MSLNDLAQVSPWLKIVLFLGVWLIAWLPIAIPLAFFLGWRPPTPPTIAQKLPLVISLYLLAPPLLWGFASIEGTSFAAYGIAWEFSVLTAIALGLAVGVIGLIGLFVQQQLAGWLTWQPENWQKLAGVLLPTLLIGLGISCIEELVFRGFLLNQLQQVYAGWLAAIVSSLIFAILHLVWEGREAVTQLPGLWLMGMVLVLARWLDGGRLGVAIGLHAGWIWGMASLDSAQLVAYTGKASEWLTGLAGKPLAGILGIVFLAVTAGFLWWSKDWLMI
jgi:uncharacterized protein